MLTPALADSLARLRELLTGGRYSEVEAGARALLAQVEETEGKESFEASEVLDVLVQALANGGKAAKPETRHLAERAVRATGSAVGEGHERFANALNNLASVLHYAGDDAGALPLQQRALAIWEKILGPEHPAIAASLNNVATLHRAMGDYARARPLYERALAIREKADPDDPQVAWILNNLANLHHLTGDYEAAAVLHERALAIREKALGPNHPHLAFSLANLANLRREAGDLAGARPLYERALAIQEKALGPEHTDVAGTLLNLSLLHSATGDHAAARPLSERALAIREKALGPDHRDVATCLTNLGLLLYQVGDHAGARPLLERALAIREKALGPHHPDVSWSLNNLALLHSAAGDHAGAKPLYERALAIREKAVGPDHPDVAMHVSNLAILLHATRDYAGARRLFERALAIREKALGPDHPVVAGTCNGLSHLLLDAGEPREALERALRAERLSRQHVGLAIRTLPESKALGFAAVRISGLHVALTVLAGPGPGDPETVTRCWDEVVRSRALVLDEMAARRRTLSEAAEPEAAAMVEGYRAARRRLANLLVRGPREDHPQRYRALLDSARKQSETAERKLAERSATFRAALARARAGLAEVRGALPVGSALVAYVRYYHIEAERGDSVTGTVGPSYLAFVLGAGQERPYAVALGGANEVDSLVDLWRQQASRPPSSEPEAREETACRHAGAVLKATVWDPVVRHLLGVERVFVVPDGALFLVNFSALPVGESEYVVDKGPTVHLLNAERDLLMEPATPARGLLAIGAPDYQAGPDTTGVESAKTAGMALAAGIPFRGARSGCGELGEISWTPLPGTGPEVSDIVSLWNRYGAARRPAASHRGGAPAPLGGMLTGAAANEAAFKALAPGRAVLHVATHGFFLGRRCASVLEEARGIRGVQAAQEEDPPPAAGENPLLLSGLVLAGANRRDQAGAGAEDGVVTAEEIAALDLSGLEWAVLSACETGVGDVRAGEGVLGLRRAFQVAGAQTLIMSLWAVEDQETRRWMRALYEGRLRRRLRTAEAVRAAMLTVLRERRVLGESTHPFFWGAFVAAGDWR